MSTMQRKRPAHQFDPALGQGRRRVIAWPHPIIRRAAVKRTCNRSCGRTNAGAGNGQRQQVRLVLNRFEPESDCRGAFPLAHCGGIGNAGCRIIQREFKYTDVRTGLSGNR